MQIIPLASHVQLPLGVTVWAYQTQNPEDAAKRHYMLHGYRPVTMYVTNSGYCLVPMEADKQHAAVGKEQEYHRTPD